MERPLSLLKPEAPGHRERKGIATAVLLLDPPNPLTGMNPEQDLHSPALKIAGLPWLKRTLLALHKGGISRFFIVSETPPKAFVPDLETDSRLRGNIAWIQQNQPDLLPDLGEPRDPCLVIGLGVHVHWPLVRKLSEMAHDDASILVVQKGNGGDSFLPPVRIEGTRAVGFFRSPEPNHALALPIFSLPCGVLTGWFPDLRHAFENKLFDQKVRAYSIKPEDLCFTIQDEKSVDRIERALFQGIAGSLDGWVDTFLNRPISKRLTRGFLKTPITPNGITVLSFLIGVISSVYFAAGGYLNGMIGAVLFQFSSMLDCCDGEVARLKYLESPFGKWLDIVLDNVVHLLIFSGMTWAAVRHAPNQGYLVWGILALIGVFLSFLIVTRFLSLQENSGDPRREKEKPSRQKLVVLVSNMANRDFSVVVLSFALFGKLPWLLILVGIGSNVYALILLGLLVRSQTKNPS